MGLFSTSSEPKFVKAIREGKSVNLIPFVGPYIITSLGVRNHMTINYLAHKADTIYIKCRIFDLNSNEDFEFTFDDIKNVYRPESNVYAWDGFEGHEKARLVYLRAGMNDILLIEYLNPVYFSSIVIPIHKI